MGRSLVFSTNIPLRFSQTPRTISPRFHPNQYQPHKLSPKSSTGYRKVGIFNTNSKRKLCTRALISEVSNQRQYPKVAAKSTGPIPPSQLIEVVETAAKTGAEVVMDAVNKPRNITYKGLTDLVTDTDKMSEVAILEVVKKNFGDHLILGEEGGIIGDTSSDYLWCIDPLDGTTNFAHCYPSFAVSVGVLFQGNPAAAAVVEFVGGPMCWNTRTFTATAGGGAFCNGQKIHPSKTDKVEQSLLVTGFGYDHDDAWITNIELFKEFTDISRGVRRLGAAAVDMCHVALGVAEAYWEYRLKPWDMAAGVLCPYQPGFSTLILSLYAASAPSNSAISTAFFRVKALDLCAGTGANPVDEDQVFANTQSSFTSDSPKSVPTSQIYCKFSIWVSISAKSTGSIPPSELIEVVEAAARAGAEVVMDAVNKPRNVAYKGLADLVTDLPNCIVIVPGCANLPPACYDVIFILTDKMSEIAILEVIKKNFADHLILGEEGGIAGDTSSDYLWCVDPLDGTTNFAHCYPSFAVSVGVLFQGNPAAATVVEFVGGPMCWNTRTYTATAGGGAFCNGQKIHPSKTDKVEQSLLVTGFGCEHDDAWNTNFELFKEFTSISRGVRRLGGAAVDMCHVALGVTEGYWEYRLKPWDIAAAVLIIEEAGGVVTRMDGGKLCVFDKSVLLLERIAPATEKLKSKGIDFSLWYKPENYVTDL
ncbi:hypothetical protein Gotur_030388 [Gossypium turneri]